MLKLLITRHGQTDWNVAGKIQGRTDIELNKTGIEQAEETRDKLLNKKIDIIISSPLKRAKKTAEIIASGKEIPIFYDEDIRERGFGKYEGLKLSHDEVDAIKRSGEAGVETDDEFVARIKRFLEKIKEKYKDKTVLVVSHRGTILGMCCHLDELPICKENTCKYKVENCSVLEYEI